MAVVGEKGLFVCFIQMVKLSHKINGSVWSILFPTLCSIQLLITWLVFDQKKRKLRSSLLILGTGGGDVLGLDVSAGQLKWRVSDCHPG